MEKYNYDNDVITERIRELKDERFKYDYEFAEAIGIKKDTLRKRLSGNNYKNPWKISELMDICNVCGCDMDYILGSIDERNRETHDLKDITGLSEKACVRLLEYGTDEVIEQYKNDELSEDFSDLYEITMYEQEYRNRCLSWFLENDLLFIFEKLCIYSNAWKSHSDKMPKFDNRITQSDGSKIFMARTEKEQMFLFNINELEKDFSYLIQDYIEYENNRK